MFKTKFCSENASMEKTEYCNFAHGKSGLRLSLCKYDTYCSNSECNFSHSIPNGRNGRIKIMI